MIKEYNSEFYNSVLVLGREIKDDYELSFSPVSKCFIYEENDEIVGFIIADIFEDRAEIIDVAVDVMYRNKKIGDKLIKYVVDLSKENGCESITLEVKVTNKPALKLYKNNGFEIVSIRKKYYSNGTIDAYLMSRKL